MDKQATADDLTRAILAHKREYDRRLRRIRDDAELPETEKRRAMEQTYQQATKRHAELVTARQALGAAEAAAEGDGEQPQDMNSLIRQAAAGAQFSYAERQGQLTDWVVRSPPERPREVTG